MAVLRSGRLDTLHKWYLLLWEQKLDTKLYKSDSKLRRFKKSRIILILRAWVVNLDDSKAASHN